MPQICRQKSRLSETDSSGLVSVEFRLRLTSGSLFIRQVSGLSLSTLIRRFQSLVFGREPSFPLRLRQDVSRIVDTATDSEAWRPPLCNGTRRPSLADYAYTPCNVSGNFRAHALLAVVSERLFLAESFTDRK